MRRNNKRAFTLVETLIAVGISTAVMAGIYAAFMTGSQSWVRFSRDTIYKNELRRAMTSLLNELRGANSITIVQEEGGIAVNFLKDKEGMIAYRWNKTGPDREKIIRIHEDEKRTLAQHITQFNFQYPEDNFLRVEMNSGTNRQFQLKGQIALRAKNGLFRKGKEQDEQTQ